MLDFSENYFSLFSLPLSSEVSLDLLSRNYKHLLMKYHPDRQTDNKQKLKCIEITAYINKAYDTLKNLDSRAFYLLKLSGLVDDLEHVSIDDEDFLQEQLHLREDMETIKSAKNPRDKLEKMKQTNINNINNSYADFSKYWNIANAESLEAAKKLAYRLRFMLRLQVELNNLTITLLN